MKTVYQNAVQVVTLGLFFVTLSLPSMQPMVTADTTLSANDSITLAAAFDGGSLPSILCGVSENECGGG